MSIHDLNKRADDIAKNIQREGVGRVKSDWQKLIETQIEIEKEYCISDPARAAEFSGAVKCLRRILNKTNSANPD